MSGQPSNYIGLQVEEIIDANTDWPTLARELDVSPLANRDKYAESSQATAFEPMALAYLRALVEDQSPSALVDTLEQEPEFATACGFDSTALPSRSTFRPSRLEQRFDALLPTLRQGAKRIRQLAAKRGAPIGLALDRSSQNADTEGVSTRTVTRILRRKGKEVLTEVSNVAFPNIAFDRPKDTIYDDDELLELETLAAIKNKAANDAGAVLGDKKNPDPNLDDPYNEDGPSGESLLGGIKTLTVDEIAEQINTVLEKLYRRAYPHLRDADQLNQRRSATYADVAVDITYVAYYGDREGMKWLQGAPKDKEYRFCHKFATLAIVGENVRFVLATLPVGSVEHADTEAYPGKDRSYRAGNVIRRLLSIAEQYVNIRHLYADREFSAADVVAVLEERDINYIIPLPRDRRIKRICKRFDQKKRGQPEREGDVPIHIDSEYHRYGPVKGKPGQTRVQTTLVVLPPSESQDRPQPFATNLEVKNLTAVDRRSTKQRIEEYSKRGGIEQSYSSIKKCAAWTTSKAFEVRWFHFAFATIVYNTWLLVDLLTQMRTDMVTTRPQPRITLDRFLQWLDQAFAGEFS